MSPMATRPSSSSTAFGRHLPLDPFTNLRWHIQPPTISPPHVVLAINAPLDCARLFDHDPFDEDSLFIIASHNEMHISTQDREFLPYIRILRLKEPVTTALLLASLLERASAIVRNWTTGNLTEPRVYELVESTNDEFVPVDPTSPIRKRRTSISSLFRSQKSAPQTRTQRPFDAIVNFLPETLSEKALLKHTILTTTLSQSFLSPPASHSNNPNTSIKSNASSSVSVASAASAASLFPPVVRRGSAFIKSKESVAGSASMSRISNPKSKVSRAQGRPHLVHVLPRTAYSQRNLVSSIEHFLSSFTTPPSLPASSAPRTSAARRHHSLLPSSSPGLNLEQATGTVPYLTRPDVLFSCPTPYSPPNPSPYLQNPGDKTVLHLILGGCLDPTNVYNHPMKAWIPSVKEITYEPAEPTGYVGPSNVQSAYPSPPSSPAGLSPPRRETVETKPLPAVPRLDVPRRMSKRSSTGSDSLLGQSWYRKVDKTQPPPIGGGLPTPDSSESSDDGFDGSRSRGAGHLRVQPSVDSSHDATDTKRTKVRKKWAFWKN